MTWSQAPFMHCYELNDKRKTLKASGWYPSISLLTTAANDTGLYTTSSSKAAFVRRIKWTNHYPKDWRASHLQLRSYQQKCCRNRRSRTNGKIKKYKGRKKIHSLFFPDWTDVEAYIWHLHKIIVDNWFVWLKTKRFYLSVNINYANLNQIFIYLPVSSPCAPLVSYEFIEYRA